MRKIIIVPSSIIILIVILHMLIIPGCKQEESKHMTTQENDALVNAEQRLNELGIQLHPPAPSDKQTDSTSRS